MGIAVGDIAAREIILTQRHQVILHLVLDLLNAHRALKPAAILLDGAGDHPRLLGNYAIIPADTLVRLENCGFNFRSVKFHLRSVSFNDLHSFYVLSHIFYSLRNTL